MAGKGGRKNLTPTRREKLLAILQERFDRHPERHGQVKWERVQSRLDANPERLWALGELERTGGEPDVVGEDPETGEFLFCDCSRESPSGRRSVCYDAEALEARKKHKPDHSAVAMATEMGATLLTEDEYRALQELGTFDDKTSSWLLTPPAFRARGGALFGDLRFGRVFVYCNGAESYYAARGFRCVVRV